MIPPPKATSTLTLDAETPSTRGHRTGRARESTGRDHRQPGEAQREAADTLPADPLVQHDPGEQHGGGRIQRGDGRDEREQAPPHREQDQRVGADVEQARARDRRDVAAWHASRAAEHERDRGEQRYAGAARDQDWPHPGIGGALGEQDQHHAEADPGANAERELLRRRNGRRGIVLRASAHDHDRDQCQRDSDERERRRMLTWRSPHATGSTPPPTALSGATTLMRPAARPRNRSQRAATPTTPAIVDSTKTCASGSSSRSARTSTIAAPSPNICAARSTVTVCTRCEVNPPRKSALPQASATSTPSATAIGAGQAARSAVTRSRASVT